MPSYWDFRLILNVDPEEDRTCVGIAKKYGRRCKNPINFNDRNTASRLLNQMNEIKHFPSSIDDLEQLASLMLCKGVHNCKTRPHLSQVDEICTRWTQSIEEEYSRIKKMRKKAALLKAKKDLLRMQKAAQAKSELETESEQFIERKPTVESHQRRPSKQPIVMDIKTEDPFITTKQAASTKSSLFNSVAPSATSFKSDQRRAPLHEELNLSAALSKPVNLKPYMHWQREISRAAKASMDAPPTPEPTPSKPSKGFTKENNGKISVSMTTTTTSTTKPEFSLDFGFITGTKSTSVFDDSVTEGSGRAAKAQEPFNQSAGLLGVSTTPDQDQKLKPQPQTQTHLCNFGTAVPDASTILSCDGKSLQTPELATTLAKKSIDSNPAFSFGSPVKFVAGQRKLRPASLLPPASIESLHVHADSPDSPPTTSEPRTVRESPQAPLAEKTITGNLRAMSGTAPLEAVTFEDDLKGKSTALIFETPLRNSASVESKMGRQHSSLSTTSEDEAVEVETISRLEVLDDIVPSDLELQCSARNSDSKSIINVDSDDDEDKENLPPLSTFEAKPHDESAQKLFPSEASGFQIPGGFPDSPPQSELVITRPSPPVSEDGHSNLPITAPSPPASEPDLEIPLTPSNRPSTPISEPGSEPAYGYALVTPSKRYSAYLPSVAQYQHGLATPPATPDNAQLFQILQDLGRRPRTRTRTPSPTGSGDVKGGEKPLPEIPTETGKCPCCGAAQDVKNGTRESGVDVGVQTEEDADAGEKETGQDDVDDNGAELRTGCKASLGLGRLRNGVVRRFRGALAQRKVRKAEKRSSKAII